MAEEWSEADLFESDQAPEPEPEPADAPEVAAAEGLALRTPSRASLLSDITAVNSPTVTARPSEDGKACKKRAFAPEELVFSLDGEEEGDGDAEPAEEQPPVKLQNADGGAALAWQRGGFLPPHAWCQSLPANAPSTEAPFLPGSVLEGRGGKLTGTSAMRLRNTVLRQTGFLEVQAQTRGAQKGA